MFCYYDSRDKLCCSHFGAIAEGDYMRLRLRLPTDCGAWHAFLLLTKDGGDTVWHEMEFEFENGGALYYKIDLKLTAGLYWYRFCFKTEWSQTFITKTNGSRGFGDGGGSWQKSVYSKSFSTPDWLTGGVIYQIFPDRFYNSKTPKADIPKSRWLRDDWGGSPEWKQNDPYYCLCNDFFGGDLKGIEQKLDYLESLGVTCIYLNPIFLASSNHRYNTADYEKIDTLLGCEQDFINLCKSAHERDIKIILDGVFSHTGDDSKYFDRYNQYGNGAAQSKTSPYFNWYKFKNWPSDYHSWWGVSTLPEVNEDNPEFLEYICGENGILRYWLRLGADGWRLDVADELPDVFLDRLREAVKAENPEAFILGEVWEDASNKESYGVRRRYFEGRQLDSVMNYPFASAMVDFIRYDNAESLNETVLSILENYPKLSVDILMNHVGTHDTARILTMLGLEGDIPHDREAQSCFKLTPEQREKARLRLKLISVLQYTLPGVPSLFYGDEAGLEGFSDPFCRGCYPWGNEDKELLEHYKFLGAIRKKVKALKDGSFEPIYAQNGVFAFIRETEDSKLFVGINNSFNSIDISLNTMLGGTYLGKDVLHCGGTVAIPPQSFVLILKQ